LRLRPDNAAALHNLGLALHDQGKLEESVEQFQQAVRLRPDFADAHSDLGMVLAKLKRWDDAAAHFQQVIRLRPDQPDGLIHLGAVLRELGKLDESAERLRQAARMKPDDASLHSSLGLTLQMLGRLTESEEHLRIALKLDPKHADAHNNLAVTLAQMCRFPEAIEQYDEAIRLQPEQAIFRRNRALAWLTLGDFEKGWPEYEQRWKCPGFTERDYPQPRWRGEPLAGKTILLYAEQGLGDTLQFIRYARFVKRPGATVIVEVQPGLARLLAKIEGVDRIVPQGEPLPRFDVHCPLLSLPGVFQTSVETIPGKTPYLFADPERADFWRRELEPFPDFKVGICWQGNPKQGSDRLRSIPLIHFASLARMRGVRLFSLQREPGAEQLRDLGDAFPIIDLARRLDLAGGAFLDTAAVMTHLDLVITCDTAIAHLAGALGVPVWLALSAAADWRWLDGRQDSPWYPTMRLFRQSKLGRWDDVFERMAEELKHKAEKPANPKSIPVELAPGELLDKITILQIKAERITDPTKLRNVRSELAFLSAARDRSLPPSEQISALMQELKGVNEAIWDIEDALRACERAQRFDSKFIEQARSVYRNNDRRAAIKRQINEHYAAQFIEEKEHPAY
jgi:tetratricopeptide (TPR) repeat protein